MGNGDGKWRISECRCHSGFHVEQHCNMAGLTEKSFLDFVAIFRDGKGVNTKACSYRDCVLLQERTGPESNISFQTVILECVSHESRAQVGKYDKRVLVVVVVDGGRYRERVSGEGRGARGRIYRNVSK